MEYKIELKHKNGAVSILYPFAFDYDVIHDDEPEYYDNGMLAGYKTDHYCNVSIDELWNINANIEITQSIDYKRFRCKYKTTEDCNELINIIKLMSDTTRIPYKMDIISQGELIFVDKPTKMKILGVDDTVEKIGYNLINCIPECIDFDKNEIHIASDNVRINVE